MSVYWVGFIPHGLFPAHTVTRWSECLYFNSRNLFAYIGSAQPWLAWSTLCRLDLLELRDRLPLLPVWGSRCTPPCWTRNLKVCYFISCMCVGLYMCLLHLVPFLLCGSWGLNSDCQAWQQALVPTDSQLYQKTTVGRPTEALLHLVLSMVIC